jgi:hypothetical protein
MDFKMCRGVGLGMSFRRSVDVGLV